MSNTKQTPLYFDLLHASEGESAEAPILFDASKYALSFHAAACTQTPPPVRDQPLTRLLLITGQGRSDLDAATPPGACSLRLERTSSTRVTGVLSDHGSIPVIRGANIFPLICQSLLVRAEVFIPHRIVFPVLCSKALFAPAALLLL